MKPITPAQLKLLNTLVSKMHIPKDEKAMMVEGFSDGRCTSSKDLFSSEAIEIIKHLKSFDPEESKATKMRKKIFYYAHEMHWQIKKDGKLLIDPKRVDDWCIKYSYLKKKLDRYTYKELPKLVSQFENVYRHFLKSI
jgi:hypothetical protein